MLRLKNYSINYKGTLLIYALLFFFCTSPFWILGEVVSPYSQCIEFGYNEPCRDDARIEHRGFTDHPDFYIPEVYQHLNGARSGWLGLWTKQNELSRPLGHLAGFSSAYFPSWILAQFTNNPWRFITVYSLLTCFFAGIFVILFCREMNLRPLAGLIAGSTLAVSPSLMFWLIFPMYLSVWCWAAGALWGITRISKKCDLLGWGILAFSIHSLGFTAYPQLVVHHGYLLLGWGGYLGYRQQRDFGWTALSRFLKWTASAVLVGVVTTIPVMLDLAFIASESNQGLKGVSFFTMYLQGMGYLIDAVRFFVFITLPEIFGNFADESYKSPYYGFSITLLTIFFLLVNLLLDFRRTIGWWIFVITFVVLTFSFALYEFGVKYLGFNLSPVLPISNISLPLAVLAGFGADKLLDDTKTKHRFGVVFAAFIGTVGVVILALTYGFMHDLKMRWSVIGALFVVLGFLATQIDKPRPIWLLAALALVTATTAFPVMFRQSATSILSSSPLVETIRSELILGGRYAIASPGLPVLPPNLNASLGLASVHNSNSMASRRYQTWLEAMNESKQWKGGRNSSLAPDYGGAMFWMSNISLVLAPAKLVHDNLAYLKKEGEIYLYRVISRMGDGLQITAPYFLNANDQDLNIGDVRLLPKLSPVKLLDKGDLLEFDVVAGDASVFVLSQKYHRDWQAHVLNQSGWKLAKTVVINGVFQGVLLPPSTQKLRLEFKPYVRFAWIAHIFWTILLLLLGLKVWRNHRSRD